MSEKMQVGDKLYRYRFDFASGDISMHTFEVVEEASSWSIQQVRAECPEDRKLTINSGLSFVPDEIIGKVSTKGNCKYVVLAEQDIGKALRILMGYLELRFEKAKAKYLEMESMVHLVEEWMYYSTTCQDIVEEA